MTVLKSIKLIRLVRSITQRPTIHLDFKAISSHFSSSCSAAMAPIRDNKEEGRMLWVDLEMTGLDAETDQILEIACLITEKDLSIVAEGPDLVIHQSDAVLEGMDEWCVQHHGKSGLTAASKNSKIDTKEAEKMVLEFVKQHTSKGNCLIAGNSVGMDKRFIDKYMPQLSEHLHYRVVDVSTIKELCRRWYPNNYHTAPSKKCTHRAMDDIRESIEELRYYRNSIFK